MLAFWMLGIAAAIAQSCLPADSLNRGEAGKKKRFEQELDYMFSVSNFLFLNWQHDRNANQVMALQALKYVYTFHGKNRACISGSFQHNLAVQSYFDSITRIQADDNTLNSRFEVALLANLNFSVNSVLTTRIMNGYDYSVDDSGRIVKTLNSSFCTPLLWTFSGGLSVKWQDFGSVNLGLSSAKLTWIRDKSIFGKQKTNSFYGVPDGKDHRLEYGLSLQFLADKEFFKRLVWNCDLQVFKTYTAPVDVTLKNIFSVRINRFLKVSIQTRVFYEEEVSRKVQLENLVTFGFYVHL